MFFLQEKIITSVSTDSKQREVGYWGKQIFELSNHLGNVLATITDKKQQVSTNNSSTSYFEAEVQSVQDYYAFGMQMPGRKSSGGYRYSFNSMEQDDEIKGTGNSIDFGDRMQDPRTGRWLSLDKAAQEYPYLSAYAYCNNNPIVYIDPDGKRFYFAAGAANDPDKTGYPKMMLTAFNTAGIQNTVQISAHGSKSEDVNFTIGENSRQAADKITTTVQSGYVSMGIAGGFYTNSETVKVPTDWRITKATNDIKADLKKNPLAKGEQFNLSGYSTGSVIMAQAALQLAKEGQVIDNLVLIGTSISEDSQLWKDLQANKNIKNIIKKDIEGDDVKNINKGGSKLKALRNFMTKGEGHPHFKFAFGKNAKKNSEALGKELHDKGVK